VLTKRSSRMRDYVNKRYKDTPVPANIWLGVSVEDGSKKSRIKHLHDTNATVRFLSLEPLIGPLGKLDLHGMHWVIVGGESGPRHRPIDEAWVTDIRDQCQAANVAFFFKQWGGFRPKENGRDLEGRIWGEYPSPNLTHSPLAAE
jgi:protein gp37